MKLCERVTYCGLEGVFLCVCPYKEYVYPISLVVELDLMWMQITSFLRMYWQLPPW